MTVTNATIETQLNHRSVRAFTDEPVSEEVMETLFDVARHTASTVFFQMFSIIRVKNPEIREIIHQASGQPYVGGTRGELLVFLVDLHRNGRIREEAGLANDCLDWSTLAGYGLYDCLLAMQNLVVAAESLGLGTVYLGSIGGNRPSVIEALKLPKRTFPILGLLVGHPAQEPMLKPRLPLQVLVGTDAYPEVENYHEALADYDAEVHGYYDARTPEHPVPEFTAQIEKKMALTGGLQGEPLLAHLALQGLAVRDPE